LSEREPEKLPWKKMGVGVVIEATGKFTDRTGAGKHLKAGARKVLITAPSKTKVDLTLVPGVNDKDLGRKDKIISVASCTTNCLAPVLKVLNESFGIKKAMITTVHSYTNSQALVDGFSKKRRRGRTAGLNMVPTTTGATKSVVEVMPELKGKVIGLAIRVPIACGSLLDVVAELDKRMDVKLVNRAFKKAAASNLKGVLSYTEEEIVSSDVIGDSYSVVIDGLSTMQSGKLVKILAWYDNEWGYSNRVVDVIKRLK